MSIKVSSVKTNTNQAVDSKNERKDFTGNVINDPNFGKKYDNLQEVSMGFKKKALLDSTNFKDPLIHLNPRFSLVSKRSRIKSKFIIFNQRNIPIEAFIAPLIMKDIRFAVKSLCSLDFINKFFDTQPSVLYTLPVFNYSSVYDRVLMLVKDKLANSKFNLDQKKQITGIFSFKMFSLLMLTNMAIMDEDTLYRHTSIVLDHEIEDMLDEVRKEQIKALNIYTSEPYKNASKMRVAKIELISYIREELEAFSKKLDIYENFENTLERVFLYIRGLYFDGVVRENYTMELVNSSIIQQFANIYDFVERSLRPGSKNLIQPVNDLDVVIQIDRMNQLFDLIKANYDLVPIADLKKKYNISIVDVRGRSGIVMYRKFKPIGSYLVFDYFAADDNMEIHTQPYLSNSLINNALDFIDLRVKQSLESLDQAASVCLSTYFDSYFYASFGLTAFDKRAMAAINGIVIEDTDENRNSLTDIDYYYKFNINDRMIYDEPYTMLKQEVYTNEPIDVFMNTFDSQVASNPDLIELDDKSPMGIYKIPNLKNLIKTFRNVFTGKYNITLNDDTTNQIVINEELDIKRIMDLKRDEYVYIKNEYIHHLNELHNFFNDVKLKLSDVRQKVLSNIDVPDVKLYGSEIEKFVVHQHAAKYYQEELEINQLGLRFRHTEQELAFKLDSKLDAVYEFLKKIIINKYTKGLSGYNLATIERDMILPLNIFMKFVPLLMYGMYNLTDVQDHISVLVKENVFKYMRPDDRNVNVDKDITLEIK